MKKGFASVLIVIILGCMVTLCLAFAEAGCSYCARSCAENYCILAGRSLLSEYQKELNERYGLFMLRGYDDELSSLARFYLSADTLLSSSVLRMTCVGADVDSSEYRGLDTDLFLAQIKKLGLHEAAESAVSRNELCEGLKITSDVPQAPSAEDLEEALDELGSSDSAGASETGKPEVLERIRQAVKLLGSLRRSQKTDAVKASKKTVPASVKKELPSQLLGYSSRNTLISAGIADISAEDFLLGEYVIGVCSNDSKKRSDTLLELETEYVIFGAASDSANKRLAQNNLYALRFSLNVLSIMSDPKLGSMVSSAAAVFPLIPQPLAAAAIVSIWAGIETRQDLAVLSEGESVPVYKDASDFATDVFAFLDKKDSAGRSAGFEGFGCYEDYLRIMLGMIPEKEKAARLMDVMQMNVSCVDGKPFSFRDYAYGFELDADFSRTHYLADPFSKGAGGHVNEVHVYR